MYATVLVLPTPFQRLVVLTLVFQDFTIVSFQGP